MEVRQHISAAASYGVDRSRCRRIIMVIPLSTCTCRLGLIDVSGLAVSTTDRVLPPTFKESQTAHARQFEDDEDIPEDEAQAEPVKILSKEAEFDTIMVWGHDRLPSADDNFVKGMEEWIAFAKAVCNPLSWPGIA